MSNIDSTMLYEVVKSQGLVGGLLIYFIIQNQGILKTLENQMKLLLVCKDCPYRNAIQGEGGEKK